MKKFFGLWLLSAILISCSPSQSTQQLPQSERELIETVLGLACDNETRRMYERRIEEQRRLLKESQFKRSLANMIEDMKC